MQIPCYALCKKRQFFLTEDRYMKKIISAALLAAALFGCTAFAEGEAVKYYNSSAYINNYPIRCYSINNYCGIYVKDLVNYGFNVNYDENAKTVNITRNKDCTEISGMGEVKLPWQKNGTVYAYAGSSDIKVLLEGSEIPSYWVDGYMMILLDSMYNCGRMFWDGNAEALFLTLPDLPRIEYRPLEKAARQYTRHKPETRELDKAWYDNFPTEECDWGFTRVEGDEPKLYSWQKSMLEKFDAYYIDHSRPHAIYLTFDEGYEAGYTPQILDVLEKYNVPATFFVTGGYLDQSPDLVQRMIDGGFTVGNHTQNHRNLAKCDTGTVMNEIEILSNRLKYDFGYENSFYMRPPEGAVNEKALAIAKDMGYNTILWSFAYFDYEPSKQHGKDYAYDMITRYMHDGAIMLLHAVSSDNAAALEDVILYAKENGYELRSLDDLCNP